LLRDEESWELTARLYQEGFSLREVAKMTHTAPTTIRFRLRKQGIPLRPPGAASGGGPRVPGPELDKTVFMYVNMKMSAYDIGKALGISHSTVMYRLRRAGVKSRSRREQGLMAWRKRCLARSATE
jgi:DNA-directed RNA polymerase specialized sigma24 family protein